MLVMPVSGEGTMADNITSSAGGTGAARSLGTSSGVLQSSAVVV
jgi:hypothetical protein